MHFEVLVEDISGKRMLDQVIPRVIDASHTFRVLSYKGIGRIPKGLSSGADAGKRILLDQLPRLLSGYGKAFAGYGPDYLAAVIVVCDLDRRSRKSFEQELQAVASSARPCPEHAICLAIEEGEAWYLGDLPAIKQAYPRAKDAVLGDYKNDSICGTWELLADAIYPGGSIALKAKGWQAVGTEKSKWAETITPQMDLAANKSPSFNQFMTRLADLAQP